MLLVYTGFTNEVERDFYLFIFTEQQLWGLNPNLTGKKNDNHYFLLL
jgi:hypothetical protein